MASAHDVLLLDKELAANVKLHSPTKRTTGFRAELIRTCAGWLCSENTPWCPLPERSCQMRTCALASVLTPKDASYQQARPDVTGTVSPSTVMTTTVDVLTWPLPPAALAVTVGNRPARSSISTEIRRVVEEPMRCRRLEGHCGRLADTSAVSAGERGGSPAGRSWCRWAVSQDHARHRIEQLLRDDRAGPWRDGIYQ